jgi:hypothetical protein
VAVSGLDGHAYGSWTGHESKKMWLRHYLSTAFPNCRTMTYGYDSKLRNHGVQTIKDYNLEFLGELKKARRGKDVGTMNLSNVPQL